MKTLWVNCSEQEHETLIPAFPDLQAQVTSLDKLTSDELSTLPCAVVIGSADGSPIATAQSAHKKLPESTLIFLCPDNEIQQKMRGQIQLTPYIGRDIDFCLNDSPAELGEVLSRVSQRRKKAERLRKLLGGANQQLSANENTLNHQRHFLNQLLEQAPMGMLTLDNHYQFQAYNAAAQKLLEITDRSNLLEYIAAEQVAGFERYLRAPNGEGFLIKLANGNKSINIKASQLEEHGKQTLLLVLEDLTARIQAEEALKAANESLEERVNTRTEALQEANEALMHAAKFDGATDLYNRYHFSQLLHATLVTAPSEHQQHILIYVDLDGFKAINDCYGHHIGDEAIRQVAKLLQQSAPEEALISRHGGDEFLLLLPDSGIEKAIELSEKILETLRTNPLTYGSLILTASIGIACAPMHASNTAELLSAADAAMYLAKRDGRNQLQCYSPEMRIRERNRAQLAQDLRTALQDNALDVFYQPQYSADGKTLVGAEALTRWHSDQQGAVSPSLFIELAEETGQILELGEWVISDVLRQLSAWHQAGLLADKFRIAINVSVIQVIANDFVSKLLKQLAQYPGLSRHLEFELTENVLVRDFEKARQTIGTLRAAGIRVALDDFGTAHSGLSYLAQLPVDTVKIDKSFVQDCVINSRNAAVIESIMVLGKKLGTAVVVEGIETEAQIALLRQFGEPIFQGFYFSAACSQDDFSALLKRHQSA
ncbi:MAG: EAL domain-containing protein [Gammaproteobacteria bacterium]|nr:EAL domain-containing protein [Gammaproteobacteria bacterium]